VETQGPGEGALAGAFARLDAAWGVSLADVRRRPGPPTVLFSGGVDSGLLAWELRGEQGATLATIGLEGSNDLRAAAESVRSLPTPWQPVVVRPRDLEGIRADAAAAFPGMRENLALGLAALLRFAPSGTLVCGQGADELFLGYAHFRGLPPSEAGDRADTDLAKLRVVDWPATEALAARWGRVVSAPFLHPEFVRAARAIPLDDRLPRDRPKELWRAWARHRGVPPALAGRPKRALQYGSGIDRWLRSITTH